MLSHPFQCNYSPPSNSRFMDDMLGESVSSQLTFEQGLAHGGLIHEARTRTGCNHTPTPAIYDWQRTVSYQPGMQACQTSTSARSKHVPLDPACRCGSVLPAPGAAARQQLSASFCFSAHTAIVAVCAIEQLLMLRKETGCTRFICGHGDTV